MLVRDKNKNIKISFLNIITAPEKNFKKQTNKLKIKEESIDWIEYKVETLLYRQGYHSSFHLDVIDKGVGISLYVSQQQSH